MWKWGEREGGERGRQTSKLRRKGTAVGRVEVESDRGRFARDESRRMEKKKESWTELESHERKTASDDEVISVAASLALRGGSSHLLPSQR